MNVIGVNDAVFGVFGSRWWCVCLPATGTAQQSARTESCTHGAKETLDGWVGCYSLAVIMSLLLWTIYEGVFLSGLSV